MTRTHFVIIDHGTSSMVLNLEAQRVADCKNSINWQTKGGVDRSKMHICQWDAEKQAFVSDEGREFHPEQSPYTDEAWAAHRARLASQPPITTRFMAVLTEYERGWGSKDFHAVKFDDYGKAKAYVDGTNAKNTEAKVPDWYCVARLITDPAEFHRYERLC